MIRINPKHRGDLHKELHVPEGKKIPEGKLEEALHSKNPRERKRAVFARNAKKWNKGRTSKRK